MAMHVDMHSLFTKTRIVHYTRNENLDSILDEWSIADQLHRPNTAIIGEGSNNRKYADYRSTNYKDVHEAIGIYFRIINSEDIFSIPKKDGYIVLVMKPDLLNNCKWHLNCTENNGFFIFNEYAPFSGDNDKNAMKSFEKDNISCLSYEDLTKLYNPEIVIREDKISFDYVDYIL